MLRLLALTTIVLGLAAPVAARRSDKKHTAEAPSQASRTSHSTVTGDAQPGIGSGVSPSASPTATPAVQVAAASEPQASSGVTATAAPSGSPSQTTAAPPRTKAEIDAALADANSLFKAGQHVEAADKLLLIYAASPQPIYLFNAGQAYRRAKRPAQAKDAYQRFVDTAPGHPLVPEVRGYLRDMQTLEEMQRHEQQISLQLQQEKADATFARQALQQERSTPLYKRPMFWGVVAGVGLALVAGGIAGSFVLSRVAADSRVEISQ